MLYSRFSLIAVFLLLFSFLLPAQEEIPAGIIVRDVGGKAEFKMSGESDWSTILVGHVFQGTVTIATSINSYVVLECDTGNFLITPLSYSIWDEQKKSMNVILKSGSVRGKAVQGGGKIKTIFDSEKLHAEIKNALFEFNPYTLLLGEGNANVLDKFSSRRLELGSGDQIYYKGNLTMTIHNGRWNAVDGKLTDNWRRYDSETGGSSATGPPPPEPSSLKVEIQ